MKLFSAGLTCTLLVVFGVSPSLEAQAARIPDLDSIAGSGYLLEATSADETAGVAVFPAEFSEGRPVEILDPSGLRLHLTDAETPGEERVYRAGRLFDPPLGRFRMWLQGEWSMSPFSELVSFGSKRPQAGKVFHAMPVVAAGRVTMASPDSVHGPDAELRLLYAGRSTARADLRHELSRRRAVSRLGKGILMPEGMVVAALWAPSLQGYSALSRPFAVEGGETVAAPLRSPDASRAQLVVYVDRAGDTVASDIPSLELWVSQDGTEQPADVQILTPWGGYGMWYDLEPGRTLLGGGSDRLYVETKPLELTGGRIERFQGKLAKRPFLVD